MLDLANSTKDGSSIHNSNVYSPKNVLKKSKFKKTKLKIKKSTNEKPKESRKKPKIQRFRSRSLTEYDDVDDVTPPNSLLIKHTLLQDSFLNSNKDNKRGYLDRKLEIAGLKDGPINLISALPTKRLSIFRSANCTPNNRMSKYSKAVVSRKKKSRNNFTSNTLDLLI